MQKLRFLKALFSPFKPFKLKFYCGKMQIGTPYFLPRKWVKATPELAHKATLRTIKSEESFNTLNPSHARKIKSYEEIYKEQLNWTHAIPKRIGFDFVGLGWKTKWNSDDFRFEWAPLLSFVFFKWQIAVIVSAPEQDHYWTAWLYYELETDKTKSKKERIEQCKKGFPLLWTRYGGDTQETVDYYKYILKNKYYEI